MDEEEHLLENESFSHRNSWRLCAVLFIVLVELGLIIGSALVLNASAEDCEQPVRLWIYVSCLSLSVHTGLLILSEVFSGLLSKYNKGNFYITLNVILLQFFFLWTLIGVIWLEDEPNECYNKFYAGWAMAWATVTVFLLVFALILLGIVFLTCVTCIGSYKISRFINN